jgi:hypothetical protein
MLTRFLVTLVVCALTAGAAQAADRIIGAEPPEGGAVLVKHFPVRAGTVVSAATLVSNDLRTAFPKVALLRGPARRLTEAQALLEVTDVRAEGSHHITVRFEPVHLATATDLYAAITLPASSGVRGLRDGDGITARQLEAPGDCYFASSADADLGPMDVDYNLQLIFEQGSGVAKAGALQPEPEQLRPTTFLRAGSPNPTSGTTLVTFGLERSGAAQLAVHDVAGRQVRVLAHETLSAGMHVRDWDGRDGQGRRVAAGIYLVRLTGADKVLTQKLVMTK